MMSRAAAMALLLSLSLFHSCTMPATRIYSIHSPTEPRGNQQSHEGGVAVRILAEDYLEQPFIAHRISPYELKIARYSKWDSPPNRIVRKVLLEALLSQGLFSDVRAARTPPRGYYFMEVNLDGFEMLKSEGRTFSYLAYHVRLLAPGGAELYRARVEKQEGLSDRDNASLARELSRILQERIGESARAVAEIVRADQNTAKVPEQPSVK